MNLDLKLSSRLHSGPPIGYACCKAFKMYGIVMRLAKDFRLQMSIKTLLCALGHQSLDMVWLSDILILLVI